MIAQSLCQSFKTEILNGVHNFTAHTFKIALYSSAANLSTTTTVYTATGEITGTGYTAGGATLVNIVPSLVEGVAVVGFAPAIWATSTFTVRGALIYNSSAANAAVMVLDFGTDRFISASDFTVTFPPLNQSDAILRIV